MSKRKEIETFENEFLHLCKRHQVIHGPIESVHSMKQERKTTRTQYLEMKMNVGGSSILLTIHSSSVFEMYLPTQLNELIFKYVGKPTAYVFLSILPHAEDRNMWIRESFWLRLSQERMKLNRAFFKEAPMEDLLLLKSPVYRYLVPHTLGFRGELDILKKRSPVGNWTSETWKEIVNGYFQRKDLTGLETTMQKLGKTSNFQRLRGKIRELVEEWQQENDFKSIELFFQAIVNTLQPIGPGTKKAIVDVFFDKDPEILIQVKRIIDYEEDA